MNIFGHILPDNAILGIGPIMLEYTSNPEQEVLYASRRYFFDLHLAAHTTRVQSDWFRVRDNTEEQKKMKEWREQYFQVRDQISSRIGEPTDSVAQHNDRVEQVAQETYGLFNDLREALNEATPENRAGVNLKHERIYYNVQRLKELATI